LKIRIDDQLRPDRASAELRVGEIEVTLRLGLMVRELVPHREPDPAWSASIVNEINPGHLRLISAVQGKSRDLERFAMSAQG
jgi:hypothetical protein